MSRGKEEPINASDRERGVVSIASVSFSLETGAEWEKTLGRRLTINGSLEICSCSDSTGQSGSVHFSFVSL